MRGTDLTGQVFGKLTVTGRVGTINGKIYWTCQCECGNTTEVRGDYLKSGRKTNCGCESGFIHYDLTGEKFGRLTPIEEIGRDSGQHVIWKCKCDCGNYVNVNSRRLVAGQTRSCGCLVMSVPQRKVKKILDDNGIKYKLEYSFPDCVDSKPLKFDFAILDGDSVKYLIECGINKDGLEKFDKFKTNKDYIERHNKIKEQYCKDHGIRLIKIDYDQDVKIEDIV